MKTSRWPGIVALRDRRRRSFFAVVLGKVCVLARPRLPCHDDTFNSEKDGLHFLPKDAYFVACYGSLVFFVAAQRLRRLVVLAFIVMLVESVFSDTLGSTCGAQYLDANLD
jgi:hypothetical protein